MRPLTKSSLLWGALGALTFLAGVQALQLLTSATVSVAVALGVAAVVGVVAAGVSHWLERRLGPAFAARTEEGGPTTGEKEQP
ncbi:hypothetical protein DP107_02010 [Haloglomus irregulare]|jgi:uncharacterized membrane protein HdeD (DUF308 family)|uniref:DUF7981 domain-containing protein n=1 Tax=Haloglomus irregulare TaxID=2234134 RepID=A0A554NF11_9EURY|nr:hypothetical protein [Haloglomus irregulare]TSD15984.1 hypothetical protein DP107_02010 [Haloglomus irregulare]